MMRRSAAFLFMVTAAGAACAQTVPFKHIILVVQENRTPDNLFGSDPTFEPGVDIASSGVTSKGVTVPLTPDPIDDCYDISHTYGAFQDAYKKGFDTEPLGGLTGSGCKVPSNPAFKYVDNSSGTLDPYFAIAKANGFANRMFQTNQGSSFPAHQFLFAGTSAPSVSSPLFASSNTKGRTAMAGCLAPLWARVQLVDPRGSTTSNKPIYPCFEHPVLTDLLDAAPAPLSWRYYAPGPATNWTAPNAIRHLCVPMAGASGDLECTGSDWARDVVPHRPAQVLSDIKGCKLAAVSWVIPTPADSDHAGGNKGGGPDWVASIVNQVGGQMCGRESYWKDTATFVTWDDWGGWYDHVPPFTVVRPGAWGAGYVYGFRVPLLVVSAYTAPGTVGNGIVDSGSILAFIEHNFGLGFIGSGKTKYDNYADYQAMLPGRGSLAEYFNLATPKSFGSIPATMKADHFLAEPVSAVGPDDD